MKKIILAIFCVTFFGCEIVNIDYLKPIMITEEPSSILTNSAVFEGRVLGEGGKDVLEYGAVWSEMFPPTIQDNKIAKGERIGWFSERYDGLKSNTTYYYSAYGINEVGVGYGDIYEFTTNSEPACNPSVNNRINTNNSFSGVVSIDEITIKSEDLGLYEGNVQFDADNDWSSIQITLQFNEIDAGSPLTGEYETVYNFDNMHSTKSNGGVMLNVSNWDIGNTGGGRAEQGEKIYVENDDSGNITFIFCDVYINENYTLDGKYTYTP